MSFRTELPPAQDGDRLRLQAALADLSRIRACAWTTMLGLADLPSGRFHLLSPAMKAKLGEEVQAIEYGMRRDIAALDRLIGALGAYRPDPSPPPRETTPHLQLVRW